MSEQYEICLCHHGIKGQKWGIRRYQNEDGTLTEIGRRRKQLSDPQNVVDRNNISEIKKYKMAIIGEIHQREMIKYYDKLLSEKKPEYFICEFADEDRCYDKKTLKNRMDNATDGSTEGNKADYQYNYWCYELAYKHNCKLIGCNLAHYKNEDKLMDTEDKVREKYMLDTLKEFEGTNSVVQLGDHHLRSIPISNEFLEYTGDKEDDRGIVSDLTVSNSSPIWDYFQNRKDTCICRVNDEYQNEKQFVVNELNHSEELCHHGIKGQKWGIRRYQNEDGTLTEAGKKNLMYRNRVKTNIKSTDEVNSIVKSLSSQEKALLGAPEHSKWIEDDNEIEVSSTIAKRIVTKYKDMPVSMLEIYDDHNDGTGEIAIATRNDPQYRGKGIARAEVEQAKQWVNSNKNVTVDQLIWIAEKSNTPSINLAKSSGFEELKGKDIPERYQKWTKDFRYYGYRTNK